MPCTNVSLSHIKLFYFPLSHSDCWTLTHIWQVVSMKRKGGCNSPVLAYQVHLVCMLSLGQQCFLPVGGTFLLHWPEALHYWHSCSQLVQLTKHPVVQIMAILNEGSDVLDWLCMHLVFKYLSWSGSQFKISLLIAMSVDYFRLNLYLVSFKKRHSFDPRMTR